MRRRRPLKLIQNLGGLGLAPEWTVNPSYAPNGAWIDADSGTILSYQRNDARYVDAELSFEQRIGKQRAKDIAAIGVPEYTGKLSWGLRGPNQNIFGIEMGGENASWGLDASGHEVPAYKTNDNIVAGGGAFFLLPDLLKKYGSYEAIKNARNYVGAGGADEIGAYLFNVAGWGMRPSGDPGKDLVVSVLPLALPVIAAGFAAGWVADPSIISAVTADAPVFALEALEFPAFELPAEYAAGMESVATSYPVSAGAAAVESVPLGLEFPAVEIPAEFAAGGDAPVFTIAEAAETGFNINLPKLPEIPQPWIDTVKKVIPAVKMVQKAVAGKPNMPASTVQQQLQAPLSYQAAGLPQQGDSGIFKLVFPVAFFAGLLFF